MWGRASLKGRTEGVRERARVKIKDGKGKVQQVESSQASSPNAPSHPEVKAKAKADPKGKPKGKAKVKPRSCLVWMMQSRRCV